MKARRRWETDFVEGRVVTFFTVLSFTAPSLDLLIESAVGYSVVADCSQRNATPVFRIHGALNSILDSYTKPYIYIYILELIGMFPQYCGALVHHFKTAAARLFEDVRCSIEVHPLPDTPHVSPRTTFPWFRGFKSYCEADMLDDSAAHEEATSWGGEPFPPLPPPPPPPPLVLSPKI